MKQFYVAIIICFAAFTVSAEPIKDRWVEQKARTKDFHFSLKFSTTNDDVVAPVILRVIINKTNKVVQELPIIQAYPTGSPDNERLRIVDVNFDGYPDISIFEQSGGASPNLIYGYYLYNKKTRKFKYLTSLVLPTIDPKNKTITEFSRTSSCDHSSETYRFVRGRLTLVESWREYCVNDKSEIKTVTVTGKLRKGKMRYTKKIEK